MAYVSVPKDLSKVKTKVMFNLTKRQITCFSLGVSVGIPTFFIVGDYVDVSVATLIMMAIMTPFFMFAMYEKHGKPLEVIIKQAYRVKFVEPKIRPYKTKNFYKLLEIQYDIDKEVKELEKSNAKGKKAKRKNKK